MVQREQQKSGKRRTRHRSRKKTSSKVPTAAVFLGDVFKRPMHESLSEQEQKVVKRHLAFLKAYRQVLRLKLNANEDLWVNGVKKPEDRGGCKHLFGKIDSNTIEAALLRGKLSENNKQRLQFLEGAAALIQDVKIWVSYFQCLKETSPEVLLTAFEQSLTWIDFEQMSESKLKKLLVFLWEGFSGGTRLSLWMQLMGQKAFRAKAHSILEASSELDREMLQHMKTYDALWKKGADIILVGSRDKSSLR